MQEAFNTYSIYVLVLGSIFLVLFALLSLKIKKVSTEGKRILFGAIAVSVLVPTFVLIATTVYLNFISVSHGPVHWHSDFEIWKCGQEINLKDPVGFSNKIGTRTLHEHNDKRIHLEGLVMDPSDASLGNFFHVIGGELSNTKLSIPTDEETLTMQNGTNCGSGVGQVQAFVYSTDKESYFTQKKLQNLAGYIISPESNVPPADCVIVEFDSPKSKTDKLCRSYKVALKTGKLKGEKDGN